MTTPDHKPRRWTTHPDRDDKEKWGKEFSWFVAVVHIRMIQAQVNLVSSPSLESYMSAKFKMDTRKVREGLESVLKWQAGSWSGAPE